MKKALVVLFVVMASISFPNTINDSSIKNETQGRIRLISGIVGGIIGGIGGCSAVVSCGVGIAGGVAVGDGLGAAIEHGLSYITGNDYTTWSIKSDFSNNFDFKDKEKLFERHQIDPNFRGSKEFVEYLNNMKKDNNHD